MSFKSDLSIFGKLVPALVFLFPVFCWTIAGYASFVLVLFFMASLLYSIYRFRCFFANRDRQFWFYFLVLASPFFCEVAAQVGRGEIVFSMLDGPARFLAAAVVFVVLSRLERSDLVSWFSRGAGVAILFTFIVLLIVSLQENPGYLSKWGLEGSGGRWALDFADPINLAVYIVSFLGLVMGSYELKKSNALKEITILLPLFLMACVIAVRAQSRTSWVALVIVTEVFLLFRFYHQKKKLVVINCFLLFGILAALAYFPVIWERIDLAAQNIMSFFNGSIGTSLGVRIELFFLDLDLIREYPVFGIRDGMLPDRDSLTGVAPLIYDMKLRAGSHTEIAAQLTRKGVLFGSITVWALFLYPLFLLAKTFRHATTDMRFSLQSAALFFIAIFVSSFSIQVLNLKMTSSIYGFFLAVFFSSVYQENKYNLGTRTL